MKIYLIMQSNGYGNSAVNSTCAASGATKYFYRRSEAVEAWNRRANNGT